MSDHADTFLTIAEIAVAFAGFASIVTVLGQNSDRNPLARTLRWPLRGMIACSLVVMIGALLPTAIGWYGAADATVWRWSSGGLAVLSFLLFFGGLRDGQLVREDLSAWQRGLTLVPIALACLVAVVGAAGVLAAIGHALHLTALLLLLVLAGWLFASIVMNHIAPH